MSTPWDAVTTDADLLILGARASLLTRATLTGGAYAVVRWHGPRGFSPLLHRHAHEEEALYVLEGRLTVVTGDEESLLGVGDFVHLPRMLPHSFCIESPTATLLQLITPAGFEAALVSIAEAEARVQGAGRAERLKIMAAATEHFGVEVLGPPLTPATALDTLLSL